jgi:preprotein translocase subunit SecA
VLTLIGQLRQAVDKAAIVKWRGLVARIERHGELIKSFTNAELRKQSLALRYEVLSGRNLDDAIIEGAALVREAADRAIGLRHYPVQLLGGIAMHFGSIAVMQTGEGKTLAATVPLYLAGLTGRGAHLVTANDYLAARDAQVLKPAYELLGLTVGVVQSNATRAERLAAYAADITYATAKEVGFDFLRDRLLRRNQDDAHGNRIRQMVDASESSSSQSPVQRGTNFMLVDEADSILIDEARTPLIVSSLPDEIALTRKELYRWTAEVAAQFQQDLDFEIGPQNKQVSLTQMGRKKARKLVKPAALSRVPTPDIYNQLELAVYVQRNFFRDRQYVVRNGEIVIVDEFTGRLAEGRKWKSGLHQAIEAREGVEVTVETGEAARITIQDLFLRYPRLAGMTGTAANSAIELQKIYRVKVIEIPTNRPPQRQQWPDRVFGTEAEKWEAIVDEIETLHNSGRPVLIGTRSIDKSERLSKLLDERKIHHQVLNARQLDREAEIVAQAGQVSRVTVATNMAGRGTDIKISGAALDLGGLHVICSELHESARIDRQLIGRCGRQGDPGTFRQFMSLDDDLLELGFGTKRHAKFKQWANQQPHQLARFAPLFRAAQRKVERRHFNARKMLMYQEKQRQEIQREMGQDPYLDTPGEA